MPNSNLLQEVRATISGRGGQRLTCTAFAAVPIAFLQVDVAQLGDRITGLRWIDTVGLALVGGFLLLGAWRGLWWQVFRLVGVVAAVAVARAVTPRLAPVFEQNLPELDPRVAYGITWVILFVAVLFAAALIGRLGKKSLQAMQLSTVDRLGGAVAGGVTGALMHLALVVVIDNFAGMDWSQHTLADTYSKAATDAIGAQLPEAYAGQREPGDSSDSAPDSSGDR